MAFEPVLELRLAAYGDLPAVEVLFPSFAAGTATVTVYQLVDGRERRVRGAVRAATAGALTKLDAELAYGVSMSYRAEMFDASGASLGFTGSAEITVDEQRSFLFNPLNPSGAVAVEFRDSAAGSIERPVPHVVSHPLGRRVGVILAEPRLGVVGVRLDVTTETVEDADKVRDLVGDYINVTVPVVCVLLGAGVRMRLPRPFFAGVTSLVEQGVNYRWGGEQIDHLIEADEVAPPVPGLFIPALRNADLNVSFTSNADLNSSNISNGEVNRRYDLAGASGA